MFTVLRFADSEVGIPVAVWPREAAALIEQQDFSLLLLARLAESGGGWGACQHICLQQPLKRTGTKSRAGG